MSRTGTFLILFCRSATSAQTWNVRSKYGQVAAVWFYWNLVKLVYYVTVSCSWVFLKRFLWVLIEKILSITFLVHYLKDLCMNVFWNSYAEKCQMLEQSRESQWWEQTLLQFCCQPQNNIFSWKHCFQDIHVLPPRPPKNMRIDAKADFCIMFCVCVYIYIYIYVCICIFSHNFTYVFN